MGVELSRQDCLHTASNPTGISLILYRECCIKYLKQSVYIDIIYIQILYTIPVFVRFKEVVLHIFHYQKLSCIFTNRFLSGGVDRWVLWSLGIMWRFTPAMALGWSSWGREMWSKVERHEIVTVDSGGSFGLSRVYDWKVAKIKPIFDSRCHGIFAAGQGSELKDVYDTWWYVIIFGWHFYRFNVFRNQESHFQHSRRLLERPNGFVFGRRTWGWSPLRDHNQKSKGIMRRQVVGSCPK